MRSLPAHSRKKKLRSTGRHSAPSQVQKVARRAGMAAPAVAVVGALAAAAPHGRDHTPATPATPAAAGLAPGLMSADQMGTSATAARLMRFRAADRPRRARPAQTARFASSEPARARGARAGDSARRRPAGDAGTGISADIGGTSTGGSGPGRRGPGGTGTGTGGHPAPRCTGTGGLLPANYATIVRFLTRHGYTGLAAAGIAGNIYQESGGNPESGGGLIGWTPLPSGYVTGQPVTDLHTQLGGILAFNNQFPEYIPDLNAAGSAAGAADIYMNDFEHPGIPAASTREAAASAVAQACNL